MSVCSRRALTRRTLARIIRAMARGRRGRLVERYRSEAGVGQRHVAAEMGFPQPILSYIEGEVFPMPRGYSARMVEVIDRIVEGRASECWSPAPGRRGCGCSFRKAGIDGR